MLYSRQSKTVMRVKECFCPDSIEQALAILEEYGSSLRICAGGTDLLVMMRKGKADTSYLMDLSELNLSYIREETDSILIGAMTTLTDVQESPLLNREPYLALQRAAGWVGSPQIRNMATLVGNICTGISSADVATPLLALDAHVRLASFRGIRELPLTAFFLAPRKIAVDPDEMITEIVLPKLPAGNFHTMFRKVGTRKELFISIFNLAALLETDGGSVRTAHLAMGVMAPTPIRLPQTEAVLTGASLTPALIENAVSAMKKEVHPRTSHHASKEYRVLLAENVLRRFLADQLAGI